jgi:DNA polymerase-3 subunit alpha
MRPSFIHLRLHTEYSIRDGLIQIQPLMEQAIQLGLPALGITDQNNLFGAVKFYQNSLQYGIKPLFGADFWLFNEQQPKNPFRLSCLCQNQQGYKNLLNLLSRSYIDGQTYGQPMIQRQWLAQLGQGLILLSGAQEGDLGQALLNSDKKLLHDYCEFWKQHFPERYYVELQRTGRPQEEDYLQQAIDLADQQALPLVATNDVRFLYADDFEAHEARVCIQQGHILADPRRPRSYSEQQFLRSPQEMCQLFADLPEAAANTVEIAKRCNVSLQLGKYFLPHCSVPDKLSAEDYLSQVAKQGLEERLKKCLTIHSSNVIEKRAAYEQRLTNELEVINKMGFAGYFLIVADFTRWAKENNIPVGPGRGSGPGSLVAYALKITDIDPISYDLLFERFLNPERVSMPDFDIDFCMEGRDRVIDYVMQKNGRESVAQIITYGTMAAKAVVRDVGRVLGMPYGQVDKIAKLIPFELGITLDQALQQEPALQERYTQEEEIRTLIDLARKLEGITRNAGKHAGGIVIAPGKLTDFTPIYCEPDEAVKHLVTQFDKDDVEAVGLVKFDFLGLKTLTIMHHALEVINAKRRHQGEPVIDLNALPMHDEKTFTLLKDCDTSAIFQLESRGMQDLVKRLQPDCFEDLIALVALFRPGPLQSGMVDDFINRKHGRAKVIYPHPQLEPILRATYGVILYQEQVMQIAQVLAGYSLGAADLLRRAMGKKKAEEMATQRESFCKGAEKNGVNAQTATHIFDLMEKFAGYGFNKSHSASYALISYQTAWLKAHYPAAFMAAVLSSEMANTEKVVAYLAQCKTLGIDVAPPDLNKGNYNFTVIDNSHLSYGLGAVKGAGQAAIESIITARAAQGPFCNLFDFCQRVDGLKVNRRTIEALIKAGAFDKLGPHRASLFATLSVALQQAGQVSSSRAQGQQDLFAKLATPTYAQHYVEIAPWSDQEALQGEKEILGFYFSGHPIRRHLAELKQITTCRLAEAHPHLPKPVLLAGLITQIRTLQTKRGDRMAIITLDDEASSLDVTCFSEPFLKHRALLTIDQLILVSGEISVDSYTERFRMLAREIFSLDEIRNRHARYLELRIAESEENKLHSLAALLEKHRDGKCPLVIRYSQQNNAAKIVPDARWQVKLSESLLQGLRELLTAENVVVGYG